MTSIEKYKYIALLIHYITYRFLRPNSFFQSNILLLLSERNTTITSRSYIKTGQELLYMLLSALELLYIDSPGQQLLRIVLNDTDHTSFHNNDINNNNTTNISSYYSKTADMNIFFNQLHKTVASHEQQYYSHQRYMSNSTTQQYELLSSRTFSADYLNIEDYPYLHHNYSSYNDIANNNNNNKFTRSKSASPLKMSTTSIAMATPFASSISMKQPIVCSSSSSSRGSSLNCDVKNNRRSRSSSNNRKRIEQVPPLVMTYTTDTIQAPLLLFKSYSTTPTTTEKLLIYNICHMFVALQVVLSIHPLTHFTALIKSTASDSYEHRFFSARQYNNEIHLVRELVSIGLRYTGTTTNNSNSNNNNSGVNTMNNFHLIDEMYLHLCKLINNNPDTQSRTRGYLMFVVYLHYLRPSSSELILYLKSFLESQLYLENKIASSSSSSSSSTSTPTVNTTSSTEMNTTGVNLQSGMKQMSISTTTMPYSYTTQQLITLTRSIKTVVSKSLSSIHILPSGHNHNNINNENDVIANNTPTGSYVSNSFNISNIVVYCIKLVDNFLTPTSTSTNNSRNKTKYDLKTESDNSLTTAIKSTTNNPSATTDTARSINAVVNSTNLYTPRYSHAVNSSRYTTTNNNNSLYTSRGSNKSAIVNQIYDNNPSLSLSSSSSSSYLTTITPLVSQSFNSYNNIINNSDSQQMESEKFESTKTITVKAMTTKTVVIPELNTLRLSTNTSSSFKGDLSNSSSHSSKSKIISHSSPSSPPTAQLKYNLSFKHTTISDIPLDIDTTNSNYHDEKLAFGNTNTTNTNTNMNINSSSPILGSSLFSKSIQTISKQTLDIMFSQNPIVIEVITLTGLVCSFKVKFGEVNSMFDIACLLYHTLVLDTTRVNPSNHQDKDNDISRFLSQTYCNKSVLPLNPLLHTLTNDPLADVIMQTFHGFGFYTVDKSSSHSSSSYAIPIQPNEATYIPWETDYIWEYISDINKSKIISPITHLPILQPLQLLFRQHHFTLSDFFEFPTSSSHLSSSQENGYIKSLFHLSSTGKTNDQNKNEWFTDNANSTSRIFDDDWLVWIYSNDSVQVPTTATTTTNTNTPTIKKTTPLTETKDNVRSHKSSSSVISMKDSSEFLRVDLQFAEVSRYVNSGYYQLSESQMQFLLGIQLALSWEVYVSDFYKNNSTDKKNDKQDNITKAIQRKDEIPETHYYSSVHFILHTNQNHTHIHTQRSNKTQQQQKQSLVTKKKGISKHLKSSLDSDDDSSSSCDDSDDSYYSLDTNITAKTTFRSNNTNNRINMNTHSKNPSTMDYHPSRYMKPWKYLLPQDLHYIKNCLSRLCPDTNLELNHSLEKIVTWSYKCHHKASSVGISISNSKFKYLLKCNYLDYIRCVPMYGSHIFPDITMTAIRNDKTNILFHQQKSYMNVSAIISPYCLRIVEDLPLTSSTTTTNNAMNNSHSGTTSKSNELNIVIDSNNDDPILGRPYLIFECNIADIEVLEIIKEENNTNTITDTDVHSFLSKLQSYIFTFTYVFIFF